MYFYYNKIQIYFLFSLTKYFTSRTVYGQGTGGIFTGSLGCSATDTHINQCGFLPPRRRYCNHYYDMSLICTRKYRIICITFLYLIIILINA